MEINPSFYVKTTKGSGGTQSTVKITLFDLISTLSVISGGRDSMVRVVRLCILFCEIFYEV